MDIYCDILFGNEPVGTAKIKKEGLYYRFSCSCRFTGRVVFSIFADCGDRHVNLGVCVPKDNAFILEKRIPAKALGDGQITLYAQPRHAPMDENFVPIRAEEPFEYIEKLQKSYLCRRGETVGVVLEEI